MLKIGLFGVGHLGQIHLKCISEIDALQLVGIFDPDKEKALKMAEKYHCKAFESADALMQAIELADIVAPTTVHHQLAMLAMDHQKHFFLEKPISHTVAEARSICERAANLNIKAQVGHVERFNPAMLSVEHLSLNPMFIEAHRLALFNPRGTDVSVVLDLMIHDLDIILKLIPYPVVQIEASGVAIVSPSEDIANVRLEFENGAVVNLTASRISMKNMRKLRVFQSDAYLSMDFLNKKTEIVRIYHEQPEAAVNSMELDTLEGKKYIELALPEVAENNAIRMELESLVHAIQNERPVEVPLEDGFRALELAYNILDKIDLHKQKVLHHKNK